MFRVSMASAIGFAFAVLCLSVATVVAALRADWFLVVLDVGVAFLLGMPLWRGNLVFRGRIDTSDSNDKPYTPSNG